MLLFSPIRWLSARSVLRALPVLLLATVAPLAAATVTITDAWVRGTVDAQAVTGAYLTLRTDSPATLVGATSPVAGRVELHQMSMTQGVMRMRPVAALPLPPDKAVQLTPGGYHLMLMDLARPLQAGDKVPLALKVRDAAGRETTVSTEAVVRPLTAAPPQAGAHAH